VVVKQRLEIKDGSKVTFDTSPEKFPYVTYPMSGDAYDKKNKIIDLEGRIKNTPSETVHGKMLDI